MKCPVCDSEGAEMGLTAVYCPNRECRHYDRTAEKNYLDSVANELVPDEEFFGGHYRYTIEPNDDFWEGLFTGEDML